MKEEYARVLLIGIKAGWQIDVEVALFAQRLGPDAAIGAMVVRVINDLTGQAAVDLVEVDVVNSISGSGRRQWHCERNDSDQPPRVVHMLILVSEW
jgi:hypothetical protein